MARPRSVAETHQALSVRFPKEMLEALRKLAEQEDRSVNEQLVHITRAWFAHKKEMHFATTHCR